MELAKDTAKKAGKLLMGYFNKDVKFERKQDKSFVTEADLAAEKLIIKAISQKFPNHSIKSEEAGFIDKKSEYCWYIDPLDGTHNFLYKIPLFGVDIALVKDNKFIIGVIYLPFLDELFYAERGSGAYLNGKNISISKNNLKSAVYCSPLAPLDSRNNIIKIMGKIKDKCAEIRMLGCSVLGLAYIACGRLDFYIKFKPGLHDYGVGQVIIEEAGGKFTRVDGKEFTLNSDNFIASNGVVHKELITILKTEVC